MATEARPTSLPRSTTSSRILRCPRCTPSKFPIVTMPSRGRSEARRGSRTTRMGISRGYASLQSKVQRPKRSADDSADEVVVVGVRDPDADDVARCDVATAGVVDQEAAVDLGRLRANPPFEQAFGLVARAFDDRFEGLPA